MNKAKEYLERIKWHEGIIEMDSEECERMRSALMKMTGTYGYTAGGGTHDREALQARLLDMEKQVEDDKKALEAYKAEAVAMMRQTGNVKYYKMLYKRYVLNQRFEQIATEMDYTYRGVCYLHGRALQAFENVMEARNEEEGG